MAIELRDYQEACLRAIFENDRRDNLSVLPCGAGKTEIFLKYIKETKYKKTLIVLNKLDLLDQTEARLKKAIPELSVRLFCGSREKEEYSGQNVTIASIQSVLKSDKVEYDQIILDEVHSLDIENPEQRYAQLISQQKKAKILGFTATPYRANGYIFGKDKFFKEIIFRLGLKEMIEAGWLATPILKGSAHSHETKNLSIRLGEYDQGQVAVLVADVEKLRKQIRDALSRIKDRKKIIWFTANISHAENVVRILKEFDEPCALIHSNLSDEQRSFEKNKFENGEARHLSFVTIVAEGYDYPPIDCIVILRPTRSPVLYVQVCGRALRLSEGKKTALILDYGKVIETLGPLDDPLVEEKRPRGDNSVSSEDVALTKMKQCPSCFLMLLVSFNVCPECEYVFASANKLSAKPDEKSSILSSIVRSTILKETPLASVLIARHVSLAGKEGLIIKYNEQYALREYFSSAAPAYFRSVHKEILSDLGYNPLKPIPQLIKYKPGHILIYKEKDKYGIQFYKLKYAGEGDRNSNSSMDQSSEARDII